MGSSPIQNTSNLIYNPITGFMIYNIRFLSPRASHGQLF